MYRCFADSYSLWVFSISCVYCRQDDIHRTLVDVPPGVTSHFIFQLPGSNAEAYLTRPAGPGPVPTHDLAPRPYGWAHRRRKHGPRGEAFASDFCYAGFWPFRVPVMAQQKCVRRQTPKLLKCRLDAASLVRSSVDRFQRCTFTGFSAWRNSSPRCW